ncbi:MAG: AAA family ATPase [Ignavibacteria bacterium]|nr:AAA family ATPase [Ignavibacteria bacterium]
MVTTPDHVVSPLHALDVTEVSECVVGNLDVPELAILRRLSPRQISESAVRGFVVNAIFDILTSKPDAADSALIDEAMQLRPLSLAAVGKDVDIDTVRSLIPRFRDALTRWKLNKIVVEPHVISRTWGLQGRFDILVENHEYVDLIEMKSGSVPHNSIRPNHMAQAAAYALLFSELESKPLRSVQVWYVAADNGQFRTIGANDLRRMQKRILGIRNRIVEFEQQLAERDFSLLRKFNGSLFTGVGFAAELEAMFADVYRTADATSRTLVQAWISFLMNEQIAARDGNITSDSKGIADLTLNLETSDVERMHLSFDALQQLSHTPLRRGDPVIIQPQGESRRMMLKGSIRQISNYSIGVTLRNKQAQIDPVNIFRIDYDGSDASARSLLPSVIKFLGSPESIRRRIIGDIPPILPEPALVTEANLFPDQRATISEALGSKGLYFIQGPPGTGKTQVILKTLVHRLLDVNNERLLIVAYTNRSVAEICDALSGIDYLRHGSKDGMLASSLHEHGIPFLAHAMSARELADRITKCRCIVSTIHSLHSSPEIMMFGEFSTLIVDEASQVLDTHIVGLLSQVRRSILIGDQCQLPAVASQSASTLSIGTPLLNHLGISNLSRSYFERMVQLYKNNGWKGAFSALSSQGRMHADVMRFPSAECYSNRLQTIHAWQQELTPTPWHSVAPSRSMFIDVTEPPNNQCNAEAQKLASIAAEIADLAAAVGEFSIGIITPFRSQNTLVTSLLRKDLQSQITVDTVERFQGSQRDVILYGTAVATVDEFDSIRSECNIDGKVIDRKLNVAATRARHQFILFGRSNILSLSPSYNRFIQFTSTVTKADLS